MTETSPQDEAGLPFVAPCRAIASDAPWRWLRAGWHDFRAGGTTSLACGSAIVLLSAIVIAVALCFGTGWMVLVLLSAFIFIAPVLCLTFYTVSASLAHGRRPGILETFQAAHGHLGDALVYSLVLLVIALLWVRAGSAVQIFFPDQSAPAFTDLVLFFGIGSGIGAVFALVAFAASAFSLPMLVDRRTDAITAVVTSINAVLRNKRAMALWALMIVMAVALGFATGLVGLAITMPVVGHATWHAYREAIDASQWPQSDAPTG
jgi:uncharacterized membrane protein